MSTPGSSENNRTSAIDTALLLERCMDDAAFALLVLEKFNEQAAGDLQNILACAARADVPETARRAHALKGTAGAIGATSLMDAASQLEEAACSGAAAGVRKLSDLVATELRRCIDAVPAVRNEMKGRAG